MKRTIRYALEETSSIDALELSHSEKKGYVDITFITAHLTKTMNLPYNIARSLAEDIDDLATLAERNENQPTD